MGGSFSLTDPGSYTWTLPSDVGDIEFTLNGAGGGSGTSDAGSGAQVTTGVDGLLYDQIRLFVPVGGESYNANSSSSGGWGYHDGEDGSHYGGAGGGSAGIVGDGTPLAAAGGGAGGDSGWLGGEWGEGGGPGGDNAGAHGSGAAYNVVWYTSAGGKGGSGGSGDGENGSIYVEYETVDPGYFAVSFASQSPSSPTDEDDIDYTVNVYNTGDQQHRDLVDLYAGGSRVDTADLTLSAGGSTSTTLTWPADDSGHDVGSHSVTVDVRNTGGSDSTSTTIEQAAYYGISLGDDPVGNIELNGDQIRKVYRNDGDGEYLVWEG